MVSPTVVAVAVGECLVFIQQGDTVISLGPVSNEATSVFWDTGSDQINPAVSVFSEMARG